MKKHIIAIGGGGFGRTSKSSLIESYILNQSVKDYPKICFLHVRIEKNLKLRNGNFINYIPAIKYLIKNGYEIVFFSTTNPNLSLEGFNFFDLNIDENKRKQIYYLINSEIFFGQISGPFFLANFLDKK